jgi:hypothetical protein
LTDGVKPSFYNDCLLAANCREHGYVIVTHNREDFELIAMVEPAVRTSPRSREPKRGESGGFPGAACTPKSPTPRRSLLSEATP